MNGNRQTPTGNARKRQKWTKKKPKETDRNKKNRQKPSETDRNRQETDRNGQKL